jgi:hypothetical protein
MRRLFHDHPFLGRLAFAAVLVLAATLADSQVPVGMAPPLHFQFLNASGQPLANGRLYTYAAGTTTPLNTYVDGTGTTQNLDPIPLDATGSPSNGSTQTGIFLANNSYKFCAYDAFNVFQWCVDRISSYFGLLNSANVWTSTNLFSVPVTILAIDDQLIMGAPGAQTTLDFPPPVGNVTLEFPDTSQNILGNQSPAITTPIINGCEVVNGPGTYICVTNDATTGTAFNRPVKYTGAAHAIITGISDTSGIIGICVMGCGNTGTATVQQSSGAFCAFDGATTASDYVQNSPSINGDCTDAGASFPISGGQVLGRVTSTNSGAGAYGIDLFGPEIQGRGALCSNYTPVTVNANTTTTQVLQTCPFPSGALNQQGKSFRFTAPLNLNQSTSGAGDLYVGFGTTSVLGTYEILASESSAAGYNAAAQVTCTVFTAGASGILSCSVLVTTTATPTTTNWITISPLNLTGVVYVGAACSFGTASTANNCTEPSSVVEQLN